MSATSGSAAKQVQEPIGAGRSEMLAEYARGDAKPSSAAA
jgi:hypothetical protein